MPILLLTTAGSQCIIPLGGGQHRQKGDYYYGTQAHEADREADPQARTEALILSSANTARPLAKAGGRRFVTGSLTRDREIYIVAGMAQPLNSPLHAGAICSQCGRAMTATTEVNNRGTAVNRVMWHCDPCKATFIESVTYKMGSYGRYIPPEERKKAEADTAKKLKKPHVPAPAVPLVAGLRAASGNAAQ